MRLLVTRPQEDGERTAAALRARGHEVLLAPLLRIEAVAAELPPGPFAAILTTSANAARAMQKHPRIGELRGLPLLTVGARSAEAAHAAGFLQVRSADGDARDLVALAARHFSGAPGPLLYLAGEDRAADLAGELRRHGLTVHTAIVYRAVAAERFAPPIAQAIAAGEIDGVLHYSARSAAAFVRCAENAGLAQQCAQLTHYCLSARVAAPLIGSAAHAIRVAARPDEAALLELI